MGVLELGGEWLGDGELEGVRELEWLLLGVIEDVGVTLVVGVDVREVEEEGVELDDGVCVMLGVGVGDVVDEGEFVGEFDTE